MALWDKGKNIRVAVYCFLELSIIGKRSKGFVAAVVPNLNPYFVTFGGKVFVVLFSLVWVSTVWDEDEINKAILSRQLGTNRASDGETISFHNKRWETLGKQF